MIYVKLTLAEFAAAEAVGKQRGRPGQGIKNAHGLKGTKETGIQLHVYGAAAELAASMAIGVEWPGHVDTFRKIPDLPPDWEVRRRSKSTYDCLVRHDDTGRVLHVIGSNRDYCICGWISAKEARKNNDWVKTYGGREPSWFVPRSELYTFGTSQWHPEHLIKDTFNGVACVRCQETMGVALECMLPDCYRVDCIGCGRFKAFINPLNTSKGDKTPW